LQEIRYSGQSAVRMPYFSPDGQELGIRYRLAMEKSEHGDIRFRWKKGSKLRLYGLWLLEHARKTGYAIGVEGESDCHTLWFHKFPAFGIPGANNWREKWSEDLEGIPLIYFVIEPDLGGQAILKWLANSKIRHRARLIWDLGAKDPSELHISNPDGFRDVFQQALDTAMLWSEWASAQANSEADAAWAECEKLAEEPAILDSFHLDLIRSGVAGEGRAAKLLFLIFITRLRERLVSAVLKGPSSAGKSYLAKHVLKFFPDNAYRELTGMSEKALVYSEEPLSHKFLVIFEAAGLESNFLSYTVRSLLSEGRLIYETVEKTKDGLRARVIKKEGPTGLVITTMAPQPSQ